MAPLFDKQIVEVPHPQIPKDIGEEFKTAPQEQCLQRICDQIVEQVGTAGSRASPLSRNLSTGQQEVCHLKEKLGATKWRQEGCQ